MIRSQSLTILYPKFPVYNPKLHAQTNKIKNPGTSEKLPRVKTKSFQGQEDPNLGIFKDFKSEIKVNGKIEVFNKEIGTMKRNQIKILELKNITAEMVMSPLDGLSNKWK